VKSKVLKILICTVSNRIVASLSAQGGLTLLAMTAYFTRFASASFASRGG